MPTAAGDALWRSCAGKTRRTARDARQAAQRLRDAGETTVEPYRCPDCGSWHVGHAMSIDAMRARAAVLRARSGNAPSVPDPTRRSRRHGKRHHHGEP